ncbi:octopamine receptor beta-2R-like [Actinia tenebrosa]|uniref:Octopamine receptor beta-2R-like n=1 Tax=Actinia tenebrosa TaxID=6105 RepID=A0A6P8IYV4_ACTTE|nr:octopamine receptor beta-2R-like [Actinia tenebrosa]
MYTHSFVMLNSSFNSSSSSGEQVISREATIFYCLIMGLILTTAVFGNCLVLLAVKRTKSLRNTAAILVVNLACVDLAVTICIVPFVITTASAQGWVLSDKLCRVTGFFNSFLTAAQIMALLHISVNRFVAVTYPHSYDTKLSKKITLMMVIAGWIHSMFWCLMPFYGWGAIGFINGTLFCNILWSQQISFAATVQVMCYFIPCIIAGVLYLGVYINIHKHIKKERTRSTMSLGETNIAAAVTRSGDTIRNSIHGSLEDVEEARASREAARAAKLKRKRQRTMENRVTKTLLGVAVAFAVCWFPRGIANLWALSVDRQNVPLALEYASTAFVFLNSSVNPAIYGALNRDFYRAFVGILSCDRRIGRNRSDTEISAGSISLARKI